LEEENKKMHMEFWWENKPLGHHFESQGGVMRITSRMPAMLLQ
jgi:hypothetical protein